MTEDLGQLALVPSRRLFETPVDVRFRLAPGDRALVATGESVVAGAPILERLRDARLIQVGGGKADVGAPGQRRPDGELLFQWRNRWRVATGDMTESIDTPIAGIVREVRPGSAITVRAEGRGMRGIVALGGPTRGRLQILAGTEGELRPGSLDVGSAGTILVVGSRIDAETLTRARAMGVRGVVVGALASKERRDFLGSERRQRAALHRLPPYAVLVLDGAVRRPIASPMMAVLHALVGREVAISTDPPALLFDAPDLADVVPHDLVRIRGGALAGREGRWAGLLGPRRFAGGVHLEAAAVHFDDGPTVAVPLGDLERFA